MVDFFFNLFNKFISGFCCGSETGQIVDCPRVVCEMPNGGNVMGR